MDLGVVFILTLTVYYIWQQIGTKKTIIFLFIAPFAIGIFLAYAPILGPVCLALGLILEWWHWHSD